MTQEEPIQLVVAAFPTETGAKDALKQLDEAKDRGLIKMKDVALLTRGQDQKLHISESADKGLGRGGLIGGVAGAAVGIVAGPVGWATLGGAAVGALAAKLRDGGFPDQRLRQIGERLTPGSSAMVAVIEDVWLEDVERMLRERGADLATEAVAADIAAQLDAQAATAQTSTTQGPPGSPPAQGTPGQGAP